MRSEKRRDVDDISEEGVSKTKEMKIGYSVRLDVTDFYLKKEEEIMVKRLRKMHYCGNEREEGFLKYQACYLSTIGRGIELNR